MVGPSRKKISDRKIPTSAISPSENELANVSRLHQLFRETPLGADLIDSLALYTRRQSLMRTLFMKELYEQIIDVHGVIMEFGCRWGKNLATYIALRGILEPYNHNRKIIGFDTFSGLSGVSETDREAPHVKEGRYATSENYEGYLSAVLECLEQECPISHIKKFELIKGDVRETLPKYFENNPHTVVALAYLDMDIYAPTKAALEALLPHLTKGSIIVFDEMNWEVFPGPTIALKEVLGLDKYKIRRTTLQPIPGYIVID